MSNRTLSRRQFLVGSLTLTGAVALAACVPAAPPAAAPAAGGEAAPAAAAAAATTAPSTEPIQLVFHSRLGTHADWHQSRVALFEEQHPGLKLTVDQLDSNDMYVKVYAMSAAGTVGDVVWTYLNNPPEHKARGVMIPLDDIVAAKDYDTSQFWESLLAALTLEGQLHAIPNHGHYGTTAYYHNKTLLEKAGIAPLTPEWTTDDLVAAAMAVTAAPEVWGVRTSGGGQEHIPSYLRIFGGDVLNEDGTKCLLDQPESIAALRWLHDLQHTHKADPCQCGDQMTENFVAGTVGIFNTTTGLVGTYTKQAKAGELPFEWDVVVGPVGPSGLRGSQVSSGSFCITGNSKHTSEAFEILDFYCSKEDGIQHVIFGAGSPGGRKDVWESDELNAINPIFRQHQTIYPDGPRKWHRPANSRTSEFVDTLNNNLQAIWTNAVDFDAGVELTYSLVQEVLDKDAL